MGVSLKLFAATVAVPYLLGFLLSSKIVPEDHFHRYLQDTSLATTLDEVIVTNEECDAALASLVNKDAFEGVSLNVHRNGDAETCGEASLNWDALRKAIHTFDYCPDQFDKFDVESLLTRLLADHVQSCDSGLKDRPRGFLGHCDRGEDRTPILLDRENLVLVPPLHSLPCRFHTRDGARITSLKQLSKLLEDTAGACSANETCSAVLGLHLYAVPAGRVFMHAPSYVGEVFELPHVKGPKGLPVSLEVISVVPRVFDVHNFFTKEESADLVKRALEETSESHKIKRSTTGAQGKSVNMKRTSENGFDTHGKTSVAVKKRCLEILGYDEYIESHGDGLQILRYNLTTAYIPHLDWIDDPSGKLKHNYDSAHKGGNRYATILLYMSDLDEDAGGETVFTKGWPSELAEEDRVSYNEVDICWIVFTYICVAVYLFFNACLLVGDKAASRIGRCLDGIERRKLGGGNGCKVPQSPFYSTKLCTCSLILFSASHWGAGSCLFARRLSCVKRRKMGGQSLYVTLRPLVCLFSIVRYSSMLLLFGCLFSSAVGVWNTPRDGFPGQPINPKYVPTEDDSPTPQYQQIRATFVNSGNDPTFDKAVLYYNEDTYWGPLGKGDKDIAVNTYESHRWNLKVDGKIVKTWQILEKNGQQQTYTI